MKKNINNYTISESGEICSLICCRGLPGSGKTTFAELMAKSDYYLGEDSPVISADDYFMVDGKYKFDMNKLGAAHDSCKSRTEKELQKGTKKIFVANTFTTEREIKPYFDLAKKYDYRFMSIIVENRHGNISVHNVPEATIEKMKMRFSFMI